MSSQSPSSSPSSPPDSLSELESVARHRRSGAARAGASVPPKFRRKRISGARMDAYAQLIATPSVAPTPIAEPLDDVSLTPTAVPSQHPAEAAPRRTPRVAIALAIGLVLGIGATVTLQKRMMSNEATSSPVAAAPKPEAKMDSVPSTPAMELPEQTVTPTDASDATAATANATATSTATVPGPMPTAASTAAAEAKPDDETEPETPAQSKAFDEAAARAAVNAAAGAAAACSDGETKGSAMVSITFANSGRATIAMLDGSSRLAGTPVGSCVARTMRSASVPAYDGPVVTVRSTVSVR